MLISYQLSQTSVILRVKIRQNTTGASPGQGMTGLTSASSGLVIGTIADNEASSTAYTSGGSTIQTITTLGTYAAPTSGDCRFKEVDSTNHPGIYEIQLANARFAVSSAKSLLVSITGVSGMADCDVTIPLLSVNPYDGVHGGMSALPNTACTTNASLLTSGSGTDQISVSSGKVLLQATQTGVTIPTVTTVTNQLTAAQIATGVWQDSTAGDFTTASSIGKSLYTGNHAPGAASGLALVASQMDLVNAPNATAVTAIQHGLATPTNITAGTITTATNLTNAPTSGDFTATMKTSIGTAVAASAVASVTGNVGGNVVGSVGSVTTAVSLSASDSPTLATGTASAGGASTITLQTALGADSLPNGCIIKITSGTGANQARVITGYVNSTKVVTVDRAWTTNPDATSVYAILYADAPKTDSSLQVTAASVQGNVTGSVASVSGAVGSVTGAVGSVTGNVGGNVVGSVGSVTAGVTVTTNNDKTGYSLTQTFPSNFAALGISVGGHISNVDTLTTYTGNTPQTGDAYARIGAAGAGLTALGDARIAHLDADVSSRLATSGYTAPDNADIAAIAAKLPVNSIADETLLLAAIGTPMQAGNVTLAASQPNYAPAKAGDAMTLTAAYDAAKTAAQAGNQMDLVNAPNATAITAIQNGLSKPGTAQTIDQTTAVATSNTANTVGDCLNAARAQGFGKWTISGTTLTIYAPDGTTAVRTFTLDSATSPTSRT